MRPPTTNDEISSVQRCTIESKGFSLYVVHHAGGIVEYRVQRAQPARSKGTGFKDGIFAIAAAVLVKFVIDACSGHHAWSVQRVVLLITAALYFYAYLTNIHYESAIAYPQIGLQLETQRGPAFFGYQLTTSTSRVFMPISSISDIIINEGLCGWNVKRYLAVLIARESRLQVVFQEYDPPFEVLREAYHGLRETLFDEWQSDQKL